MAWLILIFLYLCMIADTSITTFIEDYVQMITDILIRCVSYATEMGALINVLLWS